MIYAPWHDMQQTFYIDNDEEISSVIDRLKKSLAKENYFVVPRRAIFLQSIVNLKLLKREADKLRKKVIIVTQDEMGMNMAEKAGVDVRSSLDGLEQENVEDESPISYGRSVEQNIDDEQVYFEHPDKKVRLKEVGSDDFYGSKVVHQATQRRKSREVEPVEKEAVKKIQISRMSNQGRGRMMDARLQRKSVNSLLPSNLDPQKEKQLERMFEKNRDEKPQQVPMGGKTKKIFFGFFLLCCVAFIGVAAFLYLPKASIIVTTFLEKKKIDVDITGKEAVDVDVEGAILPIRVIESRQDLTLGYDTTGKGEGNGQKARGSITIYNNFSSASQQLVATTRFESTDGKIFRLVKNVVVPGQTVVNGEAKSGAIEAEVVADNGGEVYNIESTDFKIPGFKGSPKYDKFYAKSTKAMTGGGGSNIEEGPKVVSQGDMDVAKKDIESKLKEKIKSDLESQLKDGEILLDDAIRYTNGQMTAFGRVGDKKETFDYSASGSASAMVFLKKDIEKIVEGKYLKITENQALLIQSLRLDYAGITPDFDKKTLSMRLHSELTLNNPISINEFKKELLGKNQHQIEQLIQKYPSIKNVTFEFRPGFVSRVPQYQQRVDLSVKMEAQ